MPGTEHRLPETEQIEHQKTGTTNIQRRSTKEIRENFQSLNKGLLQNNLEYLAKQDPNIKRIIEIPELHDLNLDSINIQGNRRLRIDGSTNFDGNLHQLLLQHGFNKNNLITETFGVRVCLYLSSLQLSIIQNPLSK